MCLASGALWCWYQGPILQDMVLFYMLYQLQKCCRNLRSKSQNNTVLNFWSSSVVWSSVPGLLPAAFRWMGPPGPSGTDSTHFRVVTLVLYYYFYFFPFSKSLCFLLLSLFQVRASSFQRITAGWACQSHHLLLPSPEQAVVFLAGPCLLQCSL